MATRANIRDYIREQTVIETTDWADAQVNAVIDEGYNYVATAFDWPFYFTKAAINVTADTAVYALPSDWAKTHSLVRASKRRRLREISPKDAFERWGDDFPTSSEATAFFFDYNSVAGAAPALHLVPTPSATETTAYQHYYFTTPTLLAADGSSPEWVSMFHMILADYGVWKVWQREEDYDKAAKARDDFLDGLDRMARHYLNMADDRPVILGESRDHFRRRGSAENMPFLDGA